MPALTAQEFISQDYSAGLGEEQLLAMYESMLLSRKLDERKVEDRLLREERHAQLCLRREANPVGPPGIKTRLAPRPRPDRRPVSTVTEMLTPFHGNGDPLSELLVNIAAAHLGLT